MAAETPKNGKEGDTKLKLIMQEQSLLIEEQSEIINDLMTELTNLKATCSNLLMTNECLDAWQRDGLETMQDLVTENDHLIQINRTLANDYQNLEKLNRLLRDDLRELRGTFQMDLF